MSSSDKFHTTCKGSEAWLSLTFKLNNRVLIFNISLLRLLTFCCSSSLLTELITLFCWLKFLLNWGVHSVFVLTDSCLKVAFCLIEFDVLAELKLRIMTEGISLADVMSFTWCHSWMSSSAFFLLRINYNVVWVNQCSSIRFTKITSV